MIPQPVSRTQGLGLSDNSPPGFFGDVDASLSRFCKLVACGECFDPLRGTARPMLVSLDLFRGCLMSEPWLLQLVRFVFQISPLPLISLVCLHPLALSPVILTQSQPFNATNLSHGCICSHCYRSSTWHRPVRRYPGVSNGLRETCVSSMESPVEAEPWTWKWLGTALQHVRLAR